VAYHGLRRLCGRLIDTLLPRRMARAEALLVLLLPPGAAVAFITARYILNG
jgi:hypothetical protein